MTEKTIGYARASTNLQNADSQIEALKDAGCTEIFSDIGATGDGIDHPGLRQAKAALQRGDTLIVYSTDRVTRHPPAYYRFLRDLLRDGIEFKSIANNDEAQADMLRINYGPPLPPDASPVEIALYKAGRFLLSLSGCESRQ